MTHPAAPAGSRISYNMPRVEMPGRTASPVMVLQQYGDGPAERLMQFSLPVWSAP